MEIIFEILFQVLGAILQLAGEFLLQLIAELIGDAMAHGLEKISERSKPGPPWVSALGYLIFGAAAGAITVVLMPGALIKVEWLRMLNLVVTPLLAGLAMAWIGSWRRRREKNVIRLESFSYGFCFAFAMTFVRHLFAH